MTEFDDTDKSWKYVSFSKVSTKYWEDGWSLNQSDDKIGDRDSLISVREIRIRLERDEVFQVVFEAIVGDPQLVETSNGLFEARYYMSEFVVDGRWTLFPYDFSRYLWGWFSSTIRKYKSCGDKLNSNEFLFMNEQQLLLAKKLAKEVFDIDDTSAFDTLLAEVKRCNP